MSECHQLTAPTRIFVVGCARSGTTIAQRLVAGALNALTVPETNFFPALCGDYSFRVFGAMSLWHPAAQARAALGVTWPRYRQVRESLNGLAESVARPPPAVSWRMQGCVDAFIGLLDAAAGDAGAHVWLEKSPSHLYCIDCIERFVKGARFIHVLRDGIDTVASLQDAGRKYAGKGNNFSTDLGANIARWNQAMHWHRRYAQRPGHVLVALAGIHSVNWRELTGIAPGANEILPAPQSIAREHEVWKQKAVRGDVVTAESKRELLSSAELRRLKSDLLAGGDIASIFPGLVAR